jgi:hypothetical protein
VGIDLAITTAGARAGDRDVAERLGGHDDEGTSTDASASSSRFAP